MPEPPDATYRRGLTRQYIHIARAPFREGLKPSPTTLGVNGTLPIPFVVSPDTIGIMSALRTMHMAATALQMPPFLKAAAEESRASQANACRVRPDPSLRLRMAMRSCCLGKPKCHREGLAGNNVSRSARSFGFAQDDIGGAGAYESQRIGITALSGPVEPRPPPNDISASSRRSIRRFFGS